MPEGVSPYTALAAGYDVVMEHVDYSLWAEYIHGLLQAHHARVRTLLELGCGTGSLAFELQPKGPYRYAATDGSAEMIAVARAKADLYGADVQFGIADFTDFRVDRPVDAVVLLYDGMNYLLEDDAVRALLRCTWAALRPGGLFVFDQSTPSNSLNNEPHFEDAGEAEGFRYVRRSRYDPASGLHTTTLDLEIGGRTFREEHVQRAYEVETVRRFILAQGFEVVAAYEDLGMRAASASSERVHWVVRRPR